MNRTKDIVGHGNWLKWLADNCGNISEATAKRWMQLAKRSHVIDLENCTSLRKAYIDCGILPEPKAREKGIGTEDVDIFASFIAQIAKLADIDLSSLPSVHKDEVRSQLKAIEGRL